MNVEFYLGNSLTLDNLIEEGKYFKGDSKGNTIDRGKYLSIWRKVMVTGKNIPICLIQAFRCLQQNKLQFL